MDVNKVIVHHIDKKQGLTGGKIIKSDVLLDSSEEKIRTLVERLDKSFRNKSVQYAHFKDIESLPGSSTKSILVGEGNQNFVNTTAKFTDDLFTRISSIAPSSGGYVVFCDYSPINDHRILGIFLIRMTDSFLFNESHKESAEGKEVVTFSIGDIEHLDLKKLAMACKIDLSNLQNRDISKYLSLIKSGQPDISDYFYNWLNVDIDDIESDKEYTQNLLDIVETITLPKDPETEEEIPRNQFIRDVAQYISLAETKNINLKAMSRHFYGNEDFIENFAVEKNIPINTEFKVNSAEAKRFQQFVFKTNEIHLQFPRRLLDEDRVSTTEEHQVILDDEEIFELVEQEIEKLRDE